MNCCFAMIKMRTMPRAIRASPTRVLGGLTCNRGAWYALIPALDNGLYDHAAFPSSGGDGANAGFEGERIERLDDHCFNKA
jgi:hypothetical protein